jgi:hypothetical protein
MPRDTLWRCPKCERKFANCGQVHSCGKYSVQDYLQDKSRDAVRLYRGFVALVRKCGPVTLAPAKTRIGFQARMIFAAVDYLGDRGLRAHVVLARRLEHPRFLRIESLSRGNHVHHFWITSPEQLDDDLRGWLQEAYRVGKQEHLGR